MAWLGCALCSELSAWDSQALLLLACLASLAAGEVVEDRLDHDDRSIVLLTRPFGFESNGMVDIKVDNWKVYLEEGRNDYEKDKVGFFITTAEAEAQLQLDLQAGAFRVTVL